MLNRNYIYQGAALLIPFLLSPVIYQGFGSSNFGTYSLIITWSTLLSYIVTLRSEVLFISSVNKENVAKAISGSLVIWAGGSIFVVVVACVLYPVWNVGGLLEVSILGVLLGLFSIVNYSLIVRHEFGYTAAQLVKVFVFYAFLLFFLYIEEWQTANGILFSLSLGVICAMAFSFIIYGFGGTRFRETRREVYDRSKRSFSFLVSAVLGSSREMLIASFMMLYFDSDVVGLYYFSVLYMTKAFIAYSSIQSNKIRYMAANGMVLGTALKNVVFYGVLLFVVVVLGLLFVSSLSFFKGFDFVLMYALLPVTFTYLVLMPLVSIFEILELGVVNMWFNFAASGLIAALCGIANSYVDISAFFYVLVSSFMWMVIVGLQVVYALFELRQRNGVLAAF